MRLRRKFHGKPGARQDKADFHRAGHVMRTLQTHSNATLAEIHEVCRLAFSILVRKRYGNIQSLAMVAEPFIQNHVSRRGQSVHRLLYRDWFFEIRMMRLGTPGVSGRPSHSR